MGNLTILQSITPYGKEFWKLKTVKTNLEKISRETSQGILKSDYKNPENALIRLASELINHFKDTDVDESLTMYHFTNFAASVECNIYTVPNPVFKFLSRVLKSVSKQWHDFIMRHYHISKSKWNDVNETWEIKDKVVTEDDYRNCRNEIFNKLLSGKSILSNMTDFYKKQINKTHETDSRMAIYYAKEVIKMTTEQINLIKSIGNKIFELMKADNDFKKYLIKLEGSSKAYQLRSSLINIIKKNYTVGNKETIVTLDEWVTYLFPDGQYWGEVRDLLLIFLYEKMHENNMQIDIEDGNLIEETDEDNEGC
jgi:CRISPR-associated protein Cst1